MRLFVGPCFSQLLYNPKCTGISRHIEMQDLPPVVTDDEKVENPSDRCLASGYSRSLARKGPEGLGSEPKRQVISG